MYLHTLEATRIKKTQRGIFAHNTASNLDFKINEDLLRVFLSSKGDLTLEEALVRSTGSNKLNPAFEQIIKDFESKKILSISPSPKESRLFLREDLSDHPLEMVYFEPTARCNLRCIHCFAQSPNEGNSRQMTKAEAFATLDHIDQKGVMEVCLTGGEIMHHPHAIEIMEDAVSLDSNKEDIHNYIRQGKIFGTVTRNIKKMVEAELPLRTNYILFAGLNDSSRDIRGYLEFVSSLGIPKERITFDEFCPEGRGSDLSRYKVNEVETILKIKTAYREVFKIDLNDVRSVMPEGSFCGVGLDACCIKSDGTVTPCPALYGREYNLGDVSHLNEIWETSEMLTFLRNKDHLKEGKCGSCNSLESCLGGCRAKAVTFNGSLSSYDPWMCAYCGEK